MNLTRSQGARHFHHEDVYGSSLEHDFRKALLCVAVASASSVILARMLGSKRLLWYGLLQIYLGLRQFGRLSVFSSLGWTILATITVFLFTLLRPHTSSAIPQNSSSASFSEALPENPEHDVMKDTDHSLPGQKSEVKPLPPTLPFHKPLLFPSRTTHRRLFPKPHSFNYSYLLVGVPVQHEPLPSNCMLSVHPTRSRTSQTHSSLHNPQTWFSVHSTDYLQRGPSFSRFSLRQKLNKYLTSQSIQNPGIAYPLAYLVTAPRFAGFSFNPVSFWYLYDGERRFKAMILEVNNTFDERRMYLLRREGEDGIDSKLSSSRFTSRWKKDFHVSPFNDRDGEYSVNAVDVLRTGKVDVTIVLSGEAEQEEQEEEQRGHISGSQHVGEGDGIERQSRPSADTTLKPKIIARIFSSPSLSSHDTCINPKNLNWTQRLAFLLRYSLIGFLTNPRILIEARKLWIMGLMVFYRPEPFDTTIPRVETAQEVVLEGAFQRWLQMAVEKSNWEGRVEYRPAAGLKRGEAIYFRSIENAGGGVSVGREQLEGRIPHRRTTCLEIHVLTPAFYGELAKSDASTGAMKALFDRLCFQAPSKEKMIHCSSVKDLHDLLACVPPSDGSDLTSKATRELEDPTSVSLRILVDRMRLITRKGVMSIFRAHPDLGPAFIDRVRDVSNAEEIVACLGATTAILAADKVALGSVGLLHFELGVLRVLAVMILTRMIMGIVTHVV